MSKSIDIAATKKAIKEKVGFKTYAQHGRVSGYVCPCCHSGSPDKKGGSGTGAVSEGVEPNSWYCQKKDCAAGGDIFDYIGFEMGLKTKGQNMAKEDFLKVMEECCRRFNVDPVESDSYKPSQTYEKPRYKADTQQSVKLVDQQEEKVTAPDFSAYIDKCAEQLETYPEAVDYLKKRGISLGTAKMFHIGFDPKADTAKSPGQFVNNNRSMARIIIPAGSTFYTARSIGNSAYRYINAGSPGLFGFSFLCGLSDSDIVYICEGGFSAMSVYEAVHRSVVALNGKGNISLLLNAIKENGITGKHFIILLDNDEKEDTKKEVHNTADILRCDILRTGNYATVFDICLLCSEYVKDTNDFLVHDTEGFVDALRAADEEHWITYKDFDPEILTNPAGTPSSFVSEDAEILNEYGDSLDDFNAFEEGYDKVSTNRIKSRVDWIDNMSGGGLERGSLIVVMAPPGGGKTSLVQFIMEKLADNKQPGRFIELEMSYKQVVSKSLSMRLFTKNPNAPIKIGWSDIYEHEHLTDKNSKEDIPGAFIDYRKKALPYLHYLCNMKLKDVAELKKYLSTLGNRAKKLNIPSPVVCLDYLQLCKSAGAADMQAIITDIVMTLKDYALTFDTVAICISAVNRESMKGGQISLTSGRDSSAIEFSADTVYTLNKWVVDQGLVDAQDTLTLLDLQKSERWQRLVAKQVKSRMNFSKEPVTKLYFDGEYSTFYEENDPHIPGSEAGLLNEFEKRNTEKPSYQPTLKGKKQREVI